MAKKYVVKLKGRERLELERKLRAGRESARALARVRVLLKCDEGCTDEEVVEAVGVSLGTVERSRKRFCEDGLEAILSDRPQPPRPGKRKIDGSAEARLVTLACSTPPDGREAWTMQLLADAMVRLRYVDDAVSDETVRRVLKNEIKPWLKDEWCIPPEQSAEFVWHMEDVLDVYHRPQNERFPVVGLDEKPVQLLADVREPPPAEPGVVRRQDHEYKRNGTANVFVAFEPLGNWHTLAVTDRRTRVDWAHFVRDLVDAPRYRQAEKIVLVQDQLNTHTPASLYAAFAPTEAKRIADRLEIHHTPKHGSWLNVAEIELSVLGKRLKERVGDKAKLSAACAAFAQERNQSRSGVNWRFTTADARIKLKRLYPTTEVW